ncbi:MAG: di-trans,poly-cis-decaprenylcistransferase [Chloroflexi bacterium]|nr:MAG: di-trans,poly-cis-decaprenylcistransferase [Chloroflexota bacterium]
MATQDTVEDTVEAAETAEQSSEAKYPPLENPPYHVGIIMDGNGRWAKERGKHRLEGHKAGTENLRRILEASVEFGVKMLTIYAFSTENWKRPPMEVQGLMRILENVIDRELMDLHKNGVQLRHIGQLDRIDPSLRQKVLDAIELTKNNDRLILNVAFNYGGRAEIVHAVRRMIEDNVRPEDVSEELLSQYMYTAGSPDPDLIIRTSGEFRTSNFLIWQAAYAEYYITETYWPDFGKDEYYQALRAFSQRERRFGGVKNP